MSETLRISTKRFGFPEATDVANWKFESRPGGWVIATDAAGTRYRFTVSELRGKLSFAFAGAHDGMQSGFGELVSNSHGSGGGSAQANIDADLTAQFPGKVRKVLIQSGMKVTAGEPLLLVEAMKMEFSIKAPVAGTVTSVHVKEGQQISPGDRFVDFKAAESAGDCQGIE